MAKHAPGNAPIVKLSPKLSRRIIAEWDRATKDAPVACLVDRGMPDHSQCHERATCRARRPVCAVCRRDMLPHEVGDELPAERVCDSCAAKEVQ